VRVRGARLALLLAVLGVAAVLPSAGPVGAGAYPGENGLVVFAREVFDDGFESHLFTVDPETGVIVQLTNDPTALDQQPEWSPDGKRIAFSRDTGDAGQIWVMRADGSDAGAITADPDGGATCPTWSPDGTRIAYSDAGGDIVIIPATGGAPLVTLPVATCELSWSPLGDLIAFTRGDGIEVIAPVNGATPEAVTNDPDDREPGWSPDGARIVFSTGDGGSSTIATVLANGTDRNDLTAGSDDVFPAWSPDGLRIVFARAVVDSITDHLVTMPSGGGTPVDLTSGTVEHTDLQPDWQPILRPDPPDPPDPPRPPTPTTTPIAIQVAPTFAG
jgi:Tol biopolymer transport system component